MRAMVMDRVRRVGEGGEGPLELVDIPVPSPGPGEVLLRVLACGVCHTELDEIEGRTAPDELPRVLGHEVVGRVAELGLGTSRHSVGDRLGVGWIWSSCGRCRYCMADLPNLCREYVATGRDVDGGYAEYMTVPEDFAFPVPERLSDSGAAPLLCAGAIGYRALRLTGISEGQPLGLTGFGGSGHLVLKMVRWLWPETDVYVFARDPGEREFARELGAVWAGDIGERSPELLDAIIDTTPVWRPMVEAMADLAPGGRLVVNAIRKEDADKEYLQELDYERHLWMEREIKSVANVTPRDIAELLELAGEMGLDPVVGTYPLEEANRALRELRGGNIRGAKVLLPREDGEA